jgi:redox-sensitive bicupin YhaK (pirin superfamily)
MEIVTWVVRGSLVHQDSTGRHGVIYPGLAQRMSAGRGILHSEKNDPASNAEKDAVRFIQMWVAPDTRGIEPGYEQAEIADQLLEGNLVPVASGLARHRDDSAIRISNRFAALHAARLQDGHNVQLPEAPYLHLFVAVGEVSLEGAGRLEAGDAARLTATGGQRLSAQTHAEVLVWEMHTDLAAPAT